MEWLGTALTAAVVFGALGFSVYRMIRNKKEGKACAGCPSQGGCAGCPSQRAHQ